MANGITGRGSAAANSGSGGGSGNGGRKKGLATMWRRVRERLRAELGEEVFQSWFASVEVEELNGGTLHLSVPTKFLKSWIQSHYHERVLTLWRNETDKVMKVDIRVRTPVVISRSDSDAGSTDRNTNSVATGSLVGTAGFAAGGPSTETDSNDLASPLDPRYTLDSFVVGESNRLAYEAARQVAGSGPVKADFKVLYVHGSVGLGKTHLLQSIAWTVRREQTSRRVIYLTAERFMYRFVSALKQKEAVAFKDRLRNIDLLLIDDMQYLQGPTLQQEFCHTLNALLEAGRQIVVAADRPLSELDSLDERMRSRLSAGLVADLRPFDRTVRLEILRRRLAVAKRRFPKLNLPDHVLEYVADQITGNGRDLEGAFTRIVARNQLAKYEITVETAESAIRDLVRTPEPRRIRIEGIQRLVAKHFNVTKQELISPRRTRSVVRPRQISMYLAKTMTDRSFPDIGRRFGGRDHTTVLHAVRKIERMISEDTTLAREIEMLRRLIEEMKD